MFKNSLILSLLLLMISCDKNIANLSLPDRVVQELKDSIPANEFVNINFQKTVSYKINSEINLIQIATNDSTRSIILEIDKNGILKKGRIIQHHGIITFSNKNYNFNGDVTVTYLNGEIILQSEIENNFVKKLHNYSKIISNDLTGKNKTFVSENCIDCDLPDAIVYSSINYNTTYYVSYNFLNIAGIGYYANQYLPFVPDYGSGLLNDPQLFTVNFETSEDKIPINPKSFVNCFSSISSTDAVYSVSIESNLPVNNDPDKILSINGVGHSFVTLTKTNMNGESISQVVGFYPNISFTSLSLTNVASKLINNEGHLYNASYTEYVTSSQFNNALDAILTLSNNQYNLISYNCTDFALGVFNAAGGNLVIPPFIIPFNGINYFSNTPNGLFKQIQSLNSSGNSNSKVYNSPKTAGLSHGPC